jgi:hypothetical protein
LTFQKKYGQISDGAGETYCQIPNGAGKNINSVSSLVIGRYGVM